MRRTALPFRLLTLGLALAILSPLGAMAQQQMIAEERSSLPPGTIFEILGSAGTTRAEFSWVLTHNGAFLEAGRAPLFRQRLIKEGEYVLRATATASDGAVLAERIFRITVKAGVQEEAQGTGALVRTAPPPNAEGNLTLPSERQLVRVTPTREGSHLLLDLDTNEDSNGDGDTRNDIDDEGTFFLSDGTSLFVWFALPGEQQTLLFSQQDASGQPMTQELVVSQEETGTMIVPIAGTDLITVTDFGEGRYRFAVKTDALGAVQNQPLLFHWDFGDGRQSLMDRPIHVFQSAGDFTVSVSIRDLSSTQEILATKSIVTVKTTGGSAVSSVVSSEEASSEASSAAGTGTGGGLSKMVMIVVIIGSILLVSLGIGFLGMFFISRFVKKGLDTSLQPAKSVKGDQPTSQAILSEAVPSFAIESSSAQEERELPDAGIHTEPIVERKREAPKAPKPAPLTINEEEAPAWLKQGIEEAQKKGQTPVSPPPVVLQTTQAPSTGAAKPEEKPGKATPPPQKETTSLPPWLTETAPTPTPKPETPAITEPSTPSTPPMPTDGGASVLTTSDMPATTQEPALEEVGEPPKTSEEASAPPSASQEPEFLQFAPPPETATPPPVTAPTAPVTPPVPDTPTIPPKPAPATNGSVDKEEDEEQEGNGEQKELSPEERERRRKKRQRYKANKRRREQEEKPPPQASVPVTQSKGAETPAPPPDQPPPPKKKEKPIMKQEILPAPSESDEPIAIIRADNLSPPSAPPKKNGGETGKKEK